MTIEVLAHALCMVFLELSWVNHHSFWLYGKQRIRKPQIQTWVCWKKDN